MCKAKNMNNYVLGKERTDVWHKGETLPKDW